MADSRLSDLSAAASVGSTDLLYTVQTPGVGGVKATVQQLTTALTGSTTINGATVTTSQPVLNLSQTWNAGAITFTGLKFNVTDTTSASDSLLLDLEVGGASKFSVDKTGKISTSPAGFTGITLSEFAQSLHIGAIVKAFVYDTSKDSDGGAWRKRCQATSWYNETICTGVWRGQRATTAAAWAVSGAAAGDYFQNSTDGKFYTLTGTSTASEVFRGNVREFPALCGIVAESARVVLYDLTQPGAPMWKVFPKPTSAHNTCLWPWNNVSATCLTAGNAKLAVGFNLDGGIQVIDFTSNVAILYGPYGNYRYAVQLGDVTSAVVGASFASASITAAVNDCAMTVLDSAPIDPATGLAIPTIAVATAGGTSVITDSGTVTNITYSGFNIPTIAFDQYNNIVASLFGQSYVWVLPYPWPASTASPPTGSFVYSSGGIPSLMASTNKKVVRNASGGSLGLEIRSDNPATRTKGMVAYITNAYNTGWMPGDIQAAFCADTTAETIAWNGENLLTYSQVFANAVWTKSNLTVTANSTIAPDSTSTASTFLTSAGNSPHILYQNVGSKTNNTTFTCSAYFKAGTSNYVSLILMTDANGSAWVCATLDLSTGTISKTGAGSNGRYISSAVDNPVVGWYRLSLSGSLASTGNVYLHAEINSTSTPSYGSYGYETWNALGTETIELWGAQLEQRPSASTYVPTTTAAVVGPHVLDRSVKNKEVYLYGTLQKTAVASGSQLVGYSNFSASNYLEQPYNADLDFGTGDFCVMGWFKAQTNVNILFSKSPPSSIVSPYFELQATGSVLQWIGNAGPSTISSTSNPYNIGWFHAAYVRASGVGRLYVNGVQEATSANTDNYNHSNTDTLRFGYRQDGYFSAGGMYSLFRISATAPTADQIAKIYRDELALFQPAAQCTIAGTSTAVTALSYDDATDLLQVGTSWGRTSFNNLVRVDSEATSTGAVTSISATGGAILTGGASSGRYYQPALTLREELRRKEEARRALGKLPVFFPFDGNGSNKVFVLPYGYTARGVYKDGAYVPEIAAGWVRTNDGFRETVTYATAPSSGTATAVIMAVRG